MHIHRFSMFWKLLVSCLMVRRYKDLKMKLRNLLRFFIILQGWCTWLWASRWLQKWLLFLHCVTYRIYRDTSVDKWDYFCLSSFWCSTVAKNASSGHCPSPVIFGKNYFFPRALISSAVTWVKWEIIRLNSELWGFKSMITLGGLTSVFLVLLMRFSCLWACPLRSLSSIEKPLDKHILFALSNFLNRKYF